MNILAELRRRLAAALTDFTDNPAPFAEMVRAAQNPQFGDFQANCAMPLAKQAGTNPRELAARIVAKLDLADLCTTPEVAGPGFINLRLRDDWLAEQTNRMARDERLGVGTVGAPRRIVLDYSGPNVAKPMHVGHLRSTVLGAALENVLRFLGHDVVSDNHVGDWGTQFGMIIYGYKHFLDAAAYQQDPVAELARLYRHVNSLSEQDETVAKAARDETAKLHAGDSENRRLWDEFLPHCLRALEAMYDRLGVRFDRTLGESFYDPMLPAVVDDLRQKGFAQESEGALCVFVEGNDAPFIVQKSDGAYTYATTDLATIRYRAEELRADEMLYVVDARQSEHFKLLFATAKMWGYEQRLEHIKFGTIKGKDCKPYKTRSGGTVGLESLLDESIVEARKVVDANSPELDDTTRAEVAEKVGIGGIKYADLNHHRESDYVFDWDKMLAVRGDTATYMQYAYARVNGIFLRGNEDRQAVRNSAVFRITEPAERALALSLLRFGEAVEDVAADYRPNLLTAYLFETANKYSTFYEQCPVLKSEGDTRASRLLLCDLTCRVIQKGLMLLGIETCERM